MVATETTRTMQCNAKQTVRRDQTESECCCCIMFFDWKLPINGMIFAVLGHTKMGAHAFANDSWHCVVASFQPNCSRKHCKSLELATHRTEPAVLKLLLEKHNTTKWHLCAGGNEHWFSNSCIYDFVVKLRMCGKEKNQKAKAKYPKIKRTEKNWGPCTRYIYMKSPTERW